MKSQNEFQLAVANAKTPDEIRALIFRWRGKTHHALQTIAEIGKVWDDALVQLLLIAETGPHALLRNRHRPKNAEHLVANWMVRRLQSEDTRVTLEAAEGRLLDLARMGALPLDSEACRDLVTGIKPRTKKSGLTIRQTHAIRVLLNHPEASAELLEKVLDIIGAQLAPDLVESVVLHPHATPNIRRRALLEAVSTMQLNGQIDQIMKRDDLRNDPELRPRLVEVALKFRAPYYQATLAADANPLDCADLFRKLASVARDDAGRLLIRQAEAVAPHLEMADIEPYLEHSNRDIRLAAIAATGMVRRDAHKADAPEQTRAR